MRNFYLILLFTSCFALQGISQTTVFGGTSFYFGSPLNSFEQNRKVLGSKLSYNTGVDLSLQLRMFGRIGIEGGVIQNIHSWRLKDKNFKDRHPGFEVDIRSKNQYYSLYGGLQYAQPVGYGTYVYLETGYIYNYTGGGTLSETRNFVMENEDVTVSTSYNQNSSSIYFGTGIQYYAGDRHLIFAGVRFNYGRDIMTTGTYNTVKEGNIMSEDGFTGKGTYLALQAGYKFVIFHKEKTIRVPKEPKPKKEKTKKEKVKKEKKKKEEKPEPVLPKPIDTLDTKVEGRELMVENKIEVKARTITIRVWDDQKVDGDQISLNLNGNWILEEYTLEKAAHEITAELKEGENILVLHALNLGKISPNTAALVVDDGTEAQKMVLESTLTTSGTLIIHYNP